VPALQKLAATRGEKAQLARIHALWTLEGLGALDASFVREQMKDADPQIRIQAIRASETLYKAHDKSFANDYKAMTRDTDPNVVIQAMLTLNLHKVPGYQDVIRSTSETSIVRGIKEIGTQILKPSTSQGQRPSLSDTGAGGVNMSIEERRSMQRGEGIYRELCFTCHGPDGHGTPMGGAADGSTLAPPLSGSPRLQEHRDYIIKVLLNGLTGPIADKSYPGGIMVPMGSNSDEWIADVASYVRNSFGNQAMFVTPAQVAAVRKATTRQTPWTLPELEASVPARLTNTSQWTLTASHNPEAAANAVSSGSARWDSGVAQAPGMWFQIELPSPTTVSEVQLDSTPPGGGFLVLTPPRGQTPNPATTQGSAGDQPPTQSGSTGASRGQTPNAGRGRAGFGPPGRGPVAYTLQLSRDGTSWGAPVAQGAGETPTTIIPFPAAQAKFIRITQTGSATNNEFWGIQQVRVYGRAGH
jgi:mono/diheme cytochrome c family protein